ncbi:uncharacterized protein LOC142174282 [Nicotiana tabacum]|uniref:Uncharacterized protein LOC142174282 n=1 Tax=Nicotiana tabacum TaxID=4097 RepID=A0AC58TG24_TOBAC
MTITLNKILPDLSKLEPLDRNNYKRWFQKFLIFFEQIEVDYVLFNELPTDNTNTTTIVVADYATKNKFEKDNKIVRGHLFNHMSNALFDLFINYKYTKVIWDSLEKKYGTDDAGKEKYMVHEYENLTADFLNEGMEMCEILQAMNQLKYKKKNLTIQELISHMRTEEANRLKDEEAEWFKDKMKSLSLNSSKANLVESFSTFVKDKFKGKQKKGYLKKQNYFNKSKGHIQKSKGPCDRQGQSSKNGGKAPGQANLTEGGDVIAAVDVEANMVDNKTGWILDTCALRHICANKELFHDFEEFVDGECVYIGNSTIAGVMGKGKILLKLISEKFLALNNVLGDFFGKGYLSGGLFVLNITQKIMNNASTFNSAYIAESDDLWHEAKHTKKSFKNVTSRKTELLELVHSDLADFKNTISKGGKKYYITFVDDFSRYTKVYLLKSKDEAKSMFLKYKAEVENQLNTKIKRLSSDKGGEYITNILEAFCEKNGIIHEVSTPYTLQQNGVAERKNKTLKEMMNSMLLSSGLSDNMFMSLNDRSICESRDVEFFEHVFQLKNNLPSDVPKNASISMSVNSHIVSSSSVTANEHENELRRSKRCRIEATFGLDCVIICMYVDDMLIFGRNVNVVNKTKNFLSFKFEMKDLGEANVILEIKIKRTSNGVSLSQSRYIEKILKRFNCFDVAPVKTPYDPSIQLRKNKESSICQTVAKIIGSVTFFINYTRPDIAYAVSRLSRYTHNPISEYWNALHHLLSI